MEGNGTKTAKRKGKKAMTAVIIVLAVILVAFAVGAIFCAPFSPVHKRIVASQAAAVTTVDTNKTQG